jgi:hypothetical protein
MTKLYRLCLALALLLASLSLVPPSAACVQCSLARERQCDQQCVASGHTAGACAVCSTDCVCFD